MTKFVDLLVRLPNLRTLELLGVTHRSPVTRGLKRKCAKFPNIREMTVCSTYPDFIRSCPNLESLAFRHGFDQGSSDALSSYGSELKRVGGVGISCSSDVECGSHELPSDPKRPLNGPIGVVRSCPKLQEISFSGSLWVRLPSSPFNAMQESLMLPQ